MSKLDNISRRDFIKITAIAGSVLVGGKLLMDLTGEQTVTVKETRVLMGTIINLAVVAESKAEGEQAVSATFAELERQVAIFTHRIAGSPVAVLNQSGSLANPPAELVDVLRLAASISEQTGGAFDVTIKPLVDVYQQAQPDLPADELVQDALALVNYRNLLVSEDEIAFAVPGMAITLDGIAKGFIVDAGVAELRQLGFTNVFVEAGGDLMAAGEKEEQAAWKVGVQSPRETQDGLLASFGVHDQAVATSGDYMQYFSADMRYHHILDPRSGVSAPYLASATVVAPTCAEADALATALMVMAQDAGIAMVDGLDDVEAMLVTKEMEMIASGNFVA